MIALITSAIQLTIALFAEILREWSDARAVKTAVDASNANFQIILSRAIARIQQARDSVTKPSDDAVDDELKKVGKL